MNSTFFSSRCFLLGSFLVALSAIHSPNFAQSPGNAAAFMRLGIGARAGSMGDAYVAAAHGPDAIYWNPAALALSPAWQVALTQRRYSFGRNFTFVGTTIPLGAKQAFGLGWTGFRAGNIEARQSNTADPDAYFSDDENAFALMWGYRVNDWLALGTGAKFVHQNLFNENATGYAATLAFLVKPTPILSFGAQWQDFVSSYHWTSGRQERLPSTFMLGMALQFFGSSLMTVDYHYSSAKNVAQQHDGVFRLGTEFRPLAALPLRLGYSQNAFNTGIGFETPMAGARLKVDYNFTVQDGLNQDGHALSLGFEFGKNQRADRKEHDSDFAATHEAETTMPAALTQGFTKLDSNSLDAAKSHSPLPTQAESARAKYLTPNSPKLVVFSQAKSSSKPLGMMRIGGHYEVVRKKGDWYQIKLAGKKLGWVKEGSVKLTLKVLK